MQDAETESAPLLGKKTRSLRGETRRYLTANIQLHHADLSLLVCCFLTGLIDAGSYNAWSVFMGMQTGMATFTMFTICGNTIFLALGTAGLPPGSDSLKWARSGLSILSLMFGSLITGRIYAAVGPTRRLTLFLSFLLQTLCIAIAALLVHTDTVPETSPTSKLVLIAIPLLAAQSGAQIVTAKSLGFSEVPTTVLTSIYNDLASDTQLLAWSNPKRNRRVGAVAMILLGGLSAAWLSRSEGRLTTVLWLGAAIKMLLSFSWLLFPAEIEG